MRTIVVRGAASGNSIERVTDPLIINDKLSAYLGDESKVRADSARSVAFPRSPAEVSQLLSDSSARGEVTRLSGARTGLAAGAVPQAGEHLVSLEKLKSISVVQVDAATGERFIRVGGGVTLNELNAHLKEHGGDYYFPVDPTETWAAIGGMTATNASGARSYAYGAMRKWVRALEVVLADGSQLSLRRGDAQVENGELRFSFPGGSRVLAAGMIPKPPTKNTLGYSFEEGLDAIDLFAGSEGTLGAFTEIELRLSPLPPNRLSYLQFFPTDGTALDFVERVRALKAVRCLAIEFLDRASLTLAKSSAAGGKSAPAQLVTDASAAAVYLEVEYASDDALAESYGLLEELLAELGVDSSASFAGVSDRELNELKIFRHAVPERINSIIAQRKNEIPGLHKIATDMAVPDAQLRTVYSMYQRELDVLGLEYAIFGHAGNNHFHVNMMPRTAAELDAGKKVYQKFAEEVVRMGGAVAAEHGIGRLKKHFLKIQYQNDSSGGPLESMRTIKRFFDPANLLNPGVLIDDAE